MIFQSAHIGGLNISWESLMELDSVERDVMIDRLNELRAEEARALKKK
jgi:hypothetical protein